MCQINKADSFKETLASIGIIRLWSKYRSLACFIFCFVLFLVLAVSFVFSYSPPSFSGVDMVLPGSYSPVAFDGVNMVLGDENITDSCTYGGSGDWAILCGDNCTISTDTNVGNNDVTIIGQGKTVITGDISNLATVTIRGSSASATCEVYCYSNDCFK